MKTSSDLVVVFGMQPKFGGGKTTGFALVYDNAEALRKIEPNYRLVRMGVVEKVDKGRKNNKALRKKAKKYRGLAKAAILHG